MTVLQATVVQTTAVEYLNEPPPSAAFRVTLFREDEDSEIGRVFVDQKDVHVGVPVTFQVTVEGAHVAVCRRLNVNGVAIGPEAESSKCWVNSGVYAAPLVITLGLGGPESDGLPF